MIDSGPLVGPHGPPGNRWCELDVAGPADRPVEASISVIVPVRDAPVELARTLAALGEQRHLAGDVEVIVVDDASDPGVVVPDRVGDVEVRCVRQEADGRFGAGRARNAGARAARGEVLVFLDADVIADVEAVARTVRWVQACPHAVVTGMLSFVDVADLDAAAVAEAARSGRLAQVLSARGSDDQAWRERHLSRTHDLNVEALDLFRVVIGASMAIGRDLFDRVGGVRELGVRGIEDTELGYRCQNAGALFVVDRSALQWHQGRRFFDSAAAAAAKRAREPLMADLLPVRGMRPSPALSAHRVPGAVVELTEPDHAQGGAAASGRPPVGHDAARQLSIDSFAAVEGADVVFVVAGSSGRAGSDDLRLIDPSGPGHVGVEAFDLGAAPVVVRVRPGVRLHPGTISAVRARLDDTVGVLHVVAPDHAGDLVVAARRRALARAALVDDDPARHVEIAGALFGERWVPAEDVGIAAG